MTGRGTVFLNWARPLPLLLAFTLGHKQYFIGRNCTLL